jgi:hypothetical protein
VTLRDAMGRAGDLSQTPSRYERLGYRRRVVNCRRITSSAAPRSNLLSRGNVSSGKAILSFIELVPLERVTIPRPGLVGPKHLPKVARTGEDVRVRQAGIWPPRSLVPRGHPSRLRDRI